MSKKYKGKICVYCGVKISESGDHVFARELFVNSARGNLPQVPACKSCNVAKSALETYATAVLPFGGRHVNALDNLLMAEGRLTRNQKLNSSLGRGVGTAWDRTDSNLIIKSLTIPFEAEKIEQLFCYIAKGLAAYHWSPIGGREATAEAHFLTQEGERWFINHMLNLKAHQRVYKNIGNGAVEYCGAQGVDNPIVSMWIFRIYGGVRLIECENSCPEMSSAIAVFMGPNESFEQAKLKQAWLTGSRLLT